MKAAYWEQEVESSLVISFKNETSTLLRKKIDKISSRDIQSFFGVSLRAIMISWRMCSFPKGTVERHFLWACMFLKTYETEAVLSQIAGVTPKTFRRRVWEIIGKIAIKTNDVVSS